MAKETLSFKGEKALLDALRKEAKKQDRKLSYILEAIVNQYAKRNKLI
jgi:hypothetical protein